MIPFPILVWLVFLMGGLGVLCAHTWWAPVGTEAQETRWDRAALLWEIVQAGWACGLIVWLHS